MGCGQIDKLRRTFLASIRSVLKDLPKTSDEIYCRTMLGIDEEIREYAQRHGEDSLDCAAKKWYSSRPSRAS
jgi:hypothetical protein